MSSETVTVGQIETTYTSTGRLSGYRLEIRHNGLHEYRLLRAPDQYLLKNKAEIQLAAWDEKWRRIQSKDAAFQALFQSKERAVALSTDAALAIEEAKNILAAAVKTKTRIHWAKLEDTSRFIFDHGGRFPMVIFGEAGKPFRATHAEAPAEPRPADFSPRLTFAAKLLPSLRRARIAEARARFDAAYADWRSKHDATELSNQKAEAEFQSAEQEFGDAVRAFEEKQTAIRKKIEGLKASYKSMDAFAVTTVAELILTESKYPDWVIRDFSAGYNSETGVLILEDTLPSMDNLPRISKVTYVASRNEMRTAYISDAERDRI